MNKKQPIQQPIHINQVILDRGLLSLSGDKIDVAGMGVSDNTIIQLTWNFDKRHVIGEVKVYKIESREELFGDVTIYDESLLQSKPCVGVYIKRWEANNVISKSDLIEVSLAHENKDSDIEPLIKSIK